MGGFIGVGLGLDMGGGFKDLVNGLVQIYGLLDLVLNITRTRNVIC